MKKQSVKLMLATCLLFAWPEALPAQLLKKVKAKVGQSLAQKAEKEIDKLGTKKEQKSSKKEAPTASQTTEKTPPTKAKHLAVTDGITITSPSKALKDLVLQAHKGLLRFGGCDFYLVGASRPEMNPEVNARRKQYQKSSAAFESLLQLNFAEPYLELMDLEYLTPRPKGRDITEKDMKSFAAQKLLFNAGFALISEAEKPKYFCNGQNPANCYAGVGWGGLRADEFVQNEKYAAFVKDHYKDLKAYSKQFFQDGTQTVYMVNRVKLDPNGYDFDHGGYFVQIPPRNRQFGMEYLQMNGQFFFEYLPKHNYGQELLNTINQPEYYNGYALFKLDAAKAEALLEKKIPFYYLVSKVTINFTGLAKENPSYPSARFTYHFESPVIELYGDAALQEKLAEVSLENPVFRKR